MIYVETTYNYGDFIMPIDRQQIFRNSIHPAFCTRQTEFMHAAYVLGFECGVDGYSRFNSVNRFAGNGAAEQNWFRGYRDGMATRTAATPK